MTASYPGFIDPFAGHVDMDRKWTVRGEATVVPNGTTWQITTYAICTVA